MNTTPGNHRPPSLRRLALAFALAVPFALWGQTAVLGAHLDRNEAGAMAPPATLSVLDAKGSTTLAKGLTALLQREELAPYQVPMHSYSLAGGPGQALIAKYHLQPKAQWLLINAQSDALVAQGDGIPDVQTFTSRLQRAGFRDLVKELRAYLKAFPFSLEAHEQLLNQLRQRGERAAERFMGVHIEASRERLDRGDFAGYLQAHTSLEKADLTQAKALDPVQDLEAWAAFAQELETVFRSGEWQELRFPWTGEGKALDAASPMLRSLYRRWQPAVEAALQRDPAFEPFWDLWIWMSQAQGGRPLAPLLTTLAPSPFTAEPWPPGRVVQALFSMARSQDDWRTLEPIYQSRWDKEAHPLREPVPKNPVASQVLLAAGQDVQSALLDEDWAECLGPLLESCLRSGDASQADALLLQTMGASRWPALPAKAAEIASRCGQPALAARWSVLRPADFP